MKKLLIILALTIVNISLFNGLLKAGNNLQITGNVYYKNTSTPAVDAIVLLYLVNPDQITCKVLDRVVVNPNGKYAFTCAVNQDDKLRIGAYVNDIIQNDRPINGGVLNTTDEMVELGAYANDLTMDNALSLTSIYTKTSAVVFSNTNINRIDLYVAKPETTLDILDGGGIGTYPREPILNQNYPNPFNPSTNIQFGISQQAYVSLKVYDMSGKLVAELVNEVKDKGYYTVKFDGTNLSSGFYIYRLTAGEYTSIKKMSLIK